MRFASLLLLTSLLATVARADVILGAQVGRESLGVSQTFNGMTSEDTLDTSTALGLVAGIGKPGGGDRLLVSYESYRLGDVGDLGIFAVGYHWFLPAMATTSDFRLRPFVGGEVGYGALDVSAQPGLSSGRDSNVTYGLHAGLNLVVSERAEVELGLRYTRIDLAADQQGAAGAARFAVDNNKGWWLGFNLGL